MVQNSTASVCYALANVVVLCDIYVAIPVMLYNNIVGMFETTCIVSNNIYSWLKHVYTNLYVNMKH